MNRPPVESSPEHAVLYLRMALGARGDVARREFYLAKCFSSIVDTVDIESFINAVRMAADYHI